MDILIRRTDLSAVKAALESAVFTYRRAAGVDAFLDGPGAKVRDAVHIVFENEKVRPHEHAAAPDVTESRDAGDFRILDLEALVRIKLTAFPDKDRTHLRDLIEVGLIRSILARAVCAGAWCASAVASRHAGGLKPFTGDESASVAAAFPSCCR